MKLQEPKERAMADKPKQNADVDAYIATFAPDVRARLEKVRAAIRKVAPQAQESISYRIPTFKRAGKPLLYFAAFKAHIGLYPVTDDVKAAFAKELSPYPQSKGTVRFPHDAPLPVALVSKIAKFKVRAAEAPKAATKRTMATAAAKKPAKQQKR